MSFTDRPMARQEEIWVSTVALAADYKDDGYWARRLDYYREWMLSERYAQMDTDELSAHYDALVRDHNDHPNWSQILDTVGGVLKERAATGAML